MSSEVLVAGKMAPVPALMMCGETFAILHRNRDRKSVSPDENATKIRRSQLLLEMAVDGI